MTDIPIIFSGPMVRALLDGRKTMTRRLALASRKLKEESGPGFYRSRSTVAASPWQRVKPGDRLWVRESYRYTSWDEDGWFWVNYLADGTMSKHLDVGDGDKAHALMERLSAELDRKGVPIEASGQYESTAALKSYPSIHMPRWASRLTLYVTDHKVEPLQSISADDAWNEGVDRRSKSVRQMWLFGADAAEREAIYKRACRWEFEELWRHLHGDESWEANPQVVAITFNVHKQNIDEINAKAA